MPTPTSEQVTGDGLLIVDKPSGWSSHDVVARTRRLAGTRRVGHAGTLDPMATGVLVLGINRATKLLTFLVGCDKSYDATIRLGQATVTDDAEGEVTATVDASALRDDQIRSATTKFVGQIQQVPSSVSAIKIDGKRSYARVRGGEDVALAPRPVSVHEFVVHDIRPGAGVVDLDVSVDVSSGTYVRALARDLGAELGVGGHLTALRRTRVGRFTLDDARSLDELTALREQDHPLPLIDMADAAGALFPVRALTDEEAAHLRHGRRIVAGGFGVNPVAAVDPQGALVAMLDETGKVPHSHVVFV